MTTRRPLKSRGTAWAGIILRLLMKTNVTPNQVSIASIAFALLGALGFCLSEDRSPFWLLLAATGIQLRLLCNMLDGMLAVEGGRHSPVGALYNEFPDRIADVAIILAAGYAYRSIPMSVELGWTCAILAVLTAYVRAVGASLGAGEIFSGPMAKPHRMALLTGACVLEVVLYYFGHGVRLMPAALLLMAAGCAATIVRRTIRIADHLKQLH